MARYFMINYTPMVGDSAAFNNLGLYCRWDLSCCACQSRSVGLFNDKHTDRSNCVLKSRKANVSIYAEKGKQASNRI